MYPGPGKPVPGQKNTTTSSRPRVPEGLGRLIFLLILLAVVAKAFHFYRTHPDINPADHLRGFMGGARERVAHVKERAKERATAAKAEARAANGKAANGKAASGDEKRSAGKPVPRKIRSVPAAAPLPNQVTLYLNNGERVTGSLASETPTKVVLRWDYGEAEIDRAQILKMERDPATAPEAPDAPAQSAPADGPRYVTIHLKNGRVITGEVAYEMPQEIALRFDYGEVGFNRQEILRIEPASAADLAPAP